MNNKTIIVLGGAGYIGSHINLFLKKSGYNTVIIDNLSSGHREFCSDDIFEEADILDTPRLISIFKKYQPVAVMHFAALIEVGESVQYPARYQKNNVEGTRSILEAMIACGVENIVFSSTAAVYGQPDHDTPITESAALKPVNPYGETKAQAEELIRSYNNIRSFCLRYFNAAGADHTGRTGEAHFPETHLIPLVIHTALGLRESISIFGDSYNTPDGTCIRDYIHVEDLADAHIKALDYLLKGGESEVCNLGNGKGFSVKDVIDAVSRHNEIDLNVLQAPARAGDPAYLVADSSKAKALLGWEPQYNLADIISTASAWHKGSLYKALYDKSQK